MGLTYLEMVEIGDALVGMTKADAEEQIKFDPENRDQWCEKLRWWAENRVDAEDSQ